jgi:hypothetical protein
MDQGANPIRKIVTLLQDMQKEIEAEGVKEKELYDKFMCFCNGGAEELAKTSADAGSAAESLASKAEEEKAEKSGLEGDLEKHTSDRSAAESDLAKATAIRGKESSEYEADIADQKSNYDAISGAIPALESASGASASAFLQSPDNKKQLRRAVEMAQSISAMEKKSLAAFLEAKDESSSPGSDQIVGILKSMKDEMESTMKSTTTAEEEAAKGFTELKAAKDKEIELASEAIEAKTKRVGELAVSIVQSEDGAEDAAKEKANADKTLATLDSTCKTKQAEYAEKSKTRTEEVSAISEAISILNDDDALDVFKKAGASSLVQMSKGHQTGFLQTAKGPQKLSKAQGIVASMLKVHKSHRLAFLSYTMSQQLRSANKGAVDFGAITKMIESMIGVLTAEQADDTKHKSWCQSELASSADESAANQEKIASLNSNIAESSDEIATTGEDIAALTASIAGLDKDVATSTEQRKEEHAEYLETVQLTEAAISLIGKAKNRLQKFYNPALYKAPPKVELSDEDAIVSKLSFAQVNMVKLSEAPEMPAAAYVQSPKSGGVMALMDMLAGELKASLGEAEHDEKTAQADYLELMTESQASRAASSKSITDKSAAKADMEGKLVALKESHALTLEEAQNIAGYIAELHGSCDFILDNFQLRADARTSEIEGLKSAKAVLAGASYSF